MPAPALKAVGAACLALQQCLDQGALCPCLEPGILHPGRQWLTGGFWGQRKKGRCWSLGQDLGWGNLFSTYGGGPGDPITGSPRAAGTLWWPHVRGSSCTRTLPRAGAARWSPPPQTPPPCPANWPPHLGRRAGSGWRGSAQPLSALWPHAARWAGLESTEARASSLQAAPDSTRRAPGLLPSCVEQPGVALAASRTCPRAPSVAQRPWAGTLLRPLQMDGDGGGAALLLPRRTSVFPHVELVLSRKVTSSAEETAASLRPSQLWFQFRFSCSSKLKKKKEKKPRHGHPAARADSRRTRHRKGLATPLTVRNWRAWWGRWTPWHRLWSGVRWSCSWKTGKASVSPVGGPRTRASREAAAPAPGPSRPKGGEDSASSPWPLARKPSERLRCSLDVGGTGSPVCGVG